MSPLAIGALYGVSTQHLDDPNVGLLIKQMRGEAVPQRVHGDALVELGGLRGGVTGPVELAGGDRLGRLLAGKVPAGRSLHLSHHHCRRRSSRSGASMT